MSVSSVWFDSHGQNRVWRTTTKSTESPMHVGKSNWKIHAATSRWERWKLVRQLVSSASGYRRDLLATWTLGMAPSPITAHRSASVCHSISIFSSTIIVVVEFFVVSAVEWTSLLWKHHGSFLSVWAKFRLQSGTWISAGRSWIDLN